MKRTQTKAKKYMLMKRLRRDNHILPENDVDMNIIFDARRTSDWKKNDITVC